MSQHAGSRASTGPAAALHSVDVSPPAAIDTGTGVVDFSVAPPMADGRAVATVRSASTASERLPLVLRLALMACGVAAFSGSLKEVPPFSFSPIDLTLVATITAFALSVAAAVHERRIPLGRPMTVVIFLTALIAVGAINSVPTDYGVLKSTRLVIVTLPALVAVAVAVRDRRAARYFFAVMIVLSAMQSIWINVGGERQYGFGRLTTELGTTISFGRTAGFLVIAATAWLIADRSIGPAKAVTASALIGLGTWTVLAVASKGPVLGVILAVGAMLVLQVRRLAIRTAVRVLTILTLTGLAFAVVWSRIPELSRERFIGFGDGGSAGVRQEAWDFTWQRLTGAPIGHGWGSWNEVAPVSIVYPHNILLEVWFEAGLLGALLLFCAGWLAVGPPIHHFRADRHLATLGIGAVVYWMSTALVSGDLNDNKVPLIVLVTTAAISGTASAVSSRRGTTTGQGLGEAQ